MENTRKTSTENQEMTDDFHQSVTSPPSKTLISSTHHQSQDPTGEWTKVLDQVLEAHEVHGTLTEFKLLEFPLQ